MQTFLPDPDFTKTAKILDYKRLGKQRVEAWQILQTLIGESDGWKNHPAVKMWKNYENALAYYGLCMCSEWRKRGYKDTLLNKFDTFLGDTNPIDGHMMPNWIGNKHFHSSHRSNLLRKDFNYYSKFGWQEKPDMPYFWPIER